MKWNMPILALMLAGCASAPPAPPTPTGTLLAYGMPAQATSTYAFADTSSFNIQAGAMGDIRANIASAGEASVTYSRTADALESRIHVTSFRGSMSNSAMGGGPTATEKDIDGDAVIALTPSGEVTVMSEPKLTPAVQQVGVSASFFRRFFVRLPDATVSAGASWVDTVTATDDNGGAKATVRDIVTTTLVGDTTYNGSSYVLLRTATLRNLDISGTSQGVEIAQKLSGTSNGHVVWDAQRKVLVERVEASALSGTFDLPQMGQTGLPVTASGSSRIVLR